MLKYQKILLSFTFVLLLFIIAGIWIHFSFWLFLAIVLAAAGTLAYGSVNIDSDFYCRVLCSGNRHKNAIALSFDDGPDKKITPEILEILKKHEIKAAFFCIGSKAEENQALVNRIFQEGHIIGSHSYSHHFFFDLFSPARMSEELRKTENILYRIINKRILMFRPPYGVTNPPLAKALKRLDYHVIGWSLRSKDTVLHDDKLFERLTGKLKGGDIVIFHDTIAPTVGILDKFIKFALENDFYFERPDILLSIEPYASPI